MRGSGVDLEVAAVDDDAVTGTQRDRVGFEYRMGDGNELDVEGAEFEPRAEGDLAQLGGFGEARLREFAAHERGGKRRGVDRATEARPQIRDGAEMVLMAVGEHYGLEGFPPRLDESGVGHDQFGPGGAVVREGHAAIEHDPAAVETVEIEVHADFAGAAERREDEAVELGSCHRLRRCRSMSPRRVRSGSTASMAPVAVSKSSASPPVATTVMGLPTSARMRATMPSSKPT